MNKTGSSAIQKSAAANRDRLLGDHGIEFYSGPPNHSALAALFLDDPMSFHPMHRLNSFRPEATAQWCLQERARLEAAIEASQADIFLLSGEGLSTIGPVAVDRLHAFLSKRFARTDVHIYLRDPFDYAVSKAQQNVKSGVTFAEMRRANLIDPVRRPRESDGRFSPAIQPFYRQRVEPYRDAFGAAHVHLRAFSPSSFPGGDVVHDFFDWTADIDLSDLKPLRVNESLDGAYLGVLEAINRVEPVMINGRPNLGRANDLISIAADQPVRMPFVIPEFNFDRFAEVIEEDVEWLARETGGDIDFGLEHPFRGSPPVAEADHSVVASVLNGQRLAAENNGVRMQVNRALGNLGDARVMRRAQVLDVIQRLIAKCRELDCLFEIAEFLISHDEAEIADTALSRIQMLTDEPATMTRVSRIRTRPSIA